MGQWTPLEERMEYRNGRLRIEGEGEMLRFKEGEGRLSKATRKNLARVMGKTGFFGLGFWKDIYIFAVAKRNRMSGKTWTGHTFLVVGEDNDGETVEFSRRETRYSGETLLYKNGRSRMKLSQLIGRTEDETRAKMDAWYKG